jgi:predicted Zn-dependent peptidase
MRKLILFLLFIPILSVAQSKYEVETHDQNGYSYQTVKHDPLGARIYKLSNGLTVYMSVYKDAPRIQTYIAVRAGSKSDPTNATGLAHYLEHILFKGTTKIGTSNWEKEKPLLDQIEALYEKYRLTKDASSRAKIYHQIDSTSLVAATYAIPNEYDKMLSNIGATGTNAYTFVEQTVYVNDIPSNQIEKWAEIEAERFSSVVPRLFHTELEAVYEEKNKGLDSDSRKVWESLMAGLFPSHQYGTQTTIGTVEHLKNPSITEIKKYFNTYYVPNNFAICLSGDFDPDKTIQIINKYFSKLEAKEVPAFHPAKEADFNKPVVKEVKGPDAESITIAFRSSGRTLTDNDPNSSHHVGLAPYYLKLISMILSNGQAGLIDLNLLQKQKVLSAYAYDLSLNDYSAFVLGGKPLQGQKLEDVKNLLLGQIDSIKHGKFDDWLLKAVINDYKISKMREYESNRARADAFVDAFVSYWPWENYVQEIDELENITKNELVQFANSTFKDNNYVVVYKRTGVDSTIQKVPKPVISKVPMNRENQSAFYKKVMSEPSDTITPVFVDFEKDIKKFTTKNNIPVNYLQNEENDIFQLYYVWETGRDTDPKLAQAVEYIDYLGTSKQSAEQIKKEFYKLGCSYSFNISGDQTYFTLTGLKENFDVAVKLFEKLISDPKADKEVWKDMVQRNLKARADSKLNKDVILKSAMVNYGKYGPSNPFTNILSEEQLKALDPKELTAMIKNMKNYTHRVLYYGPTSSDSLNLIISKDHKVASKLKELPPQKKFNFRDINENLVYYVNYDMVQSEIIFLTKSIPYEKSIVPVSYLFNEYFGGGMGSLVFQEMREAKALAYSVKSSYDVARRKEDPNFITSYIGTQADKLNEAVEGLNQLIEEMPESENLFANAKAAGVETINSQRITKTRILMEYEKNQKLGLDYDIRKDIYKDLKTLTFSDIKDFQKKYIKGQKKVMLVIGSKDKIDLKSLEKYGKVQELTLKEIFGY